MMEDSTESTESLHWWMMVESTESKEWEMLMRHFDKKFLWDILTRQIDGLWRTLMTFNELWYGDDFNRMALRQF